MYSWLLNLSVLYTSFFEISAQLGSCQQLPLSICLKNSVNDVFPEPKIDRLLSRLITFHSFGKIKSRGYHAFLEVKLVGCDLNLIALGVIYNFPHPLPGQFHYCFTQRGVLWDIHNG